MVGSDVFLTKIVPFLGDIRSFSGVYHQLGPVEKNSASRFQQVTLPLGNIERSDVTPPSGSLLLQPGEEWRVHVVISFGGVSHRAKGSGTFKGH